jgi:GNAT superfamily N-acetyltransferase
MNIRLANIKDLPPLAEIYKKSYNTLHIGENWSNDSALKLLEHLRHEQADLFFVAEEDGTIVGGSVALLKPWWNGNHLADGEIFIDPTFQGKGIGTQLIKHMFTEALRKYGVVSWDTFTHRVHEYPLKWYKKLGFEEIRDWVMITGDIKKVLKNIT